MNCQGCGAADKELFAIECEPTDRETEWRWVQVCDGCIERLDADMWISERCWLSINPVVPFASLPIKGPNMTYAPFSPEQVKTLNEYQESGCFHPFTCGLGCGSTLVASEAGWTCPKEGCGYTQNWAHDFMVDGSWRVQNALIRGDIDFLLNKGVISEDEAVKLKEERAKNLGGGD